MPKYYKWTWSTKDFYVKNGQNGTARRLKKTPKNAKYIVQNAGTWVKG